ncbi:hypothetical protein N7481_007580 [Penicillium waksmanii]|uniref:uncharacterized protein n=1 Tax=Penicillium waksmanii TaxID=69791 RepID=UPI002547FD7C|nr:uncharacterized protein N7481_007580 [Penicillium waksmanii]KAJ5980282.1 hypothetical protein N7481_007580 [Penicillium waksmanii]
MESVCAAGAAAAAGAGLCWEIIADRRNGRNPLSHPDGKAEKGDRDRGDGTDFGESIARHRAMGADFPKVGLDLRADTNTRSPGKVERPWPTWH